MTLQGPWGTHLQAVHGEATGTHQGPLRLRRSVGPQRRDSMARGVVSGALRPGADRTVARVLLGMSGVPDKMFSFR